jgi:tetratricopeptide (TPR) repeat protein
MRNDKLIIVGKRGDFPSILIPVATVFISSFCVMTLELVAGRLIARHLGSSLYTWTSVIGVVLTGITIGNYLGGRIADRFDAKKALSTLFAIGSVTCVLTVICNNIVGDWIFLWKFSWSLRVFTHVSLVFLLPSIILGTISPVVAKMALEKGLPTGRTVGDIYAWGAAGSIAGTFVTGYYLIAAMGTIAIIWAVGGVLMLLAVLYRARFWPLHLWTAMFLFILITAIAPMQWCKTAGAALLLRAQPDPKVLYEDESQYCYIAVKQSPNNPDRRLFMQDKLMHSEIIMGDINNLQYTYEKIYALITHTMSKNKDKLAVMVIGGGGYVFPRYVENNWPGSLVDVVEIDPRVTEAAIQAFGLERNSPINTFSMDARNYVDELFESRRNGGQTPQYDFIYEDALNDYSVPYQLVTREFNDKIAELLTDDGAYMIELIDIYASGQFLGAVINTLQLTFPHVYVITDKDTFPLSRATFIVMATKRPFDIKTVPDGNDIRLWRFGDAETEDLRKKARGVVLTDDYAPVENLLVPVVRKSGVDLQTGQLQDDIKKFKEQGAWDEVAKTCKQLIKLDPTISLFAYNEIAMSRAIQGRMEEAVEALRSAIKYNENADYKENMANIHLSIGSALRQLGQNSEADEHFQKAIVEYREQLGKDDTSPKTWTRLGETLAITGDFNEASNCFGRAIQLDPTNVTIYMNLAQTLELQGKYDEAKTVISTAIEAASQAGDNESVDKLKKFQEFQNKKTSSKN